MRLLEQEIEDVKRFREILQILFEEGFGLFLSKVNLLSHVPLMKRVSQPKQKVPTPERVRHTFERLGPTFIKFGQILAQRPDIVPQPYIKELEKLQDDVPAFDPEVARERVEAELGPIEETFTEFGEEPLAAASIAQVHRATLKNGDEVVVKIRRPGIKDQMETDIDILMTLAKQGEKHIGKLQSMKAETYVREFAQWTRDELNLEKEGRNAQIMADNLSDEDRVKIPNVYMEHTTEKVVVMEYVEGVKCNDTESLQELDVSREELAQTAIRAGIKQTIRDGFFHADPHPSNFLINERGEIVFLDFGMIGKFSQSTRRNLGLLFLHAANEDIDAAVDTVRRMAVIEDDADIDGLKEDIEESILLMRNSTLKERSVTKSLLDISIRASERGVHMPPSLAIMGKSMLTMEGIGLTLYPEFQLTDEFQRMVKEILWKTNDPRNMLQTFLIDLAENKDMFTRFPSQLHKLFDSQGQSPTTTVIDNSTKNIGSMLLVGALILSSSIIFLEILPADHLLYVAVAQLVIAALLILRLW